MLFIDVIFVDVTVSENTPLVPVKGTVEVIPVLLIINKSLNAVLVAFAHEN